MASLLPPFDGFHYHPHQSAGIHWMLEREQPGASILQGGVLADEMGLGKTCQTIGLLLNDPRVLEGKERITTLLLVPPALQPQWGEALDKAGITHLILQPPKALKKGAVLTVEEELDRWTWAQHTGTRETLVVFLATYDRAANHSETLRTLPFHRIVCDEGHILRNGPSTARFRKLIHVTAPQRWILTGTPVQNGVSDFLHVCKFLGLSAEDRVRFSLTKIAAEILLRRTVEDVRAAVPTMPTEVPLHTIHAASFPQGTLPSEEQRIYESLVGRYEHAIEANAHTSVLLELYSRICQFIAHPAIYVASMVKKYGPHYGRTTWEGTASKFAAFQAFMTSSDAAPTIVFTTYRLEMEMAGAFLTGLGYKCWKVQGGMTDKGREAMAAESKAYVASGLPTAKKAAILIQIVAGGAGLNLQHCHRVVFLSSHWNPAVVDQAIARAYRMGQTTRVDVHHFLLADDAELNLDRYKAATHGTKRSAATEVHPKLYCDSAVSSERVLDELDVAFERGPGVASVVAAAAAEDAEDPIA